METTTQPTAFMDPVDVARVRSLADIYAHNRSRREHLEGAVERDIASLPAARELAEARVRLGQLERAFAADKASHPLAAALAAAASDEEATREALVHAWARALRFVRDECPKTVDTENGRVQLRVTEGVKVTNAALLCYALARRNLAAAVVKDVKVDAKALRPLLVADPTLCEGAEPSASYSVAWTPLKE